MATILLIDDDPKVREMLEALFCDEHECHTADRAEQALELFRGALLEGLHVSDAPEFERWLDSEREQLRRRASEAAEHLAAIHVLGTEVIGRMQGPRYEEQ